MSFKKTVFSLVGILLFVISLNAQKGLQKPDDFFPHPLGEHFMPHHLIVDYFEHIAENSNNVIIEQYGETNQNRPLLVAYVSSEKNLANLEQIRKNNLKRAGILDGDIKDNNPIAIVWLGFGVHGNEAGATNSSIATIYELANPDNKEIQEWLKNTVVVVDPSLNPDGYSRYTHWNRNVGNKIPNPHIDSREHQEPWPGGRVNHYCFDLNRDWAWATQKETQARLKQYHKWMPHINVDAHEQGYNSPYYFAPAAQPYHTYITDWQGDFQHEIGKNHSKYFDKEGWLYFTKEIFDLLYPSYGDTYPTFNGAIGMTYEQAGHSLAGRRILIENGDTLGLRDRIMHHKTTALSTVEMGSKNADRIVKQFEDYYQNALKNPVGDYKSYIIKASNGSGKIKALTDLLDKHGIQYGSIKSGRTLQAYDFQTDKSKSISIEDNDLIVSTHQPLSILTQVLFEPRTKLVDSLTYDITAWALPYAYGLETYGTDVKLDPSEAYTFEKYEAPPKAQPYAYLAEWNAMNNVQFLNELIQMGIVVRTATEAFELDSNKYPPGTLIILRIDNKKKLGDRFDSLVRNTAMKYSQKLNNAMTGFVDKGRDFGSNTVSVIQKPKVAIISGNGTSRYNFGQTWYYFEQEIDMEIAVLDADNLGSVSLNDYNIVIMPDGWYGRFGDATAKKLKTWVQSGGKLIAIAGAAKKLIDQEGFAIKKKTKEDIVSDIKAEDLPHYAEQERSAISYQMPGAVYKIKMDNTHPLAFGFPDYYFSLKTSGEAFSFLEKGWNVGSVEKDPIIAGFVGAKVKASLNQSLSYGVQNLGSGKVIYMIDNPLYRGFWKQGMFLFSNAIFMVD